ncbi:hypothetical protein THAOC_13641 [Thalassiosira oceanica]|uniref:Uncharacterized protein n=1 Tax=Thalassiosira oceanica TaxID=159749 RepID=K0SKJ0_THAOC|nr:hypothetical protein THAOC_13641 [Thalassiosira oceanica]|eukprot:EJK65484.1 hypothetical protein THAOC_13641 [Thalassiosira oceanica]
MDNPDSREASWLPTNNARAKHPSRQHLPRQCSDLPSADDGLPVSRQRALGLSPRPRQDPTVGFLGDDERSMAWRDRRPVRPAAHRLSSCVLSIPSAACSLRHHKSPTKAKFTTTAKPNDAIAWDAWDDSNHLDAAVAVVFIFVAVGIVIVAVEDDRALIAVAKEKGYSILEYGIIIVSFIDFDSVHDGVYRAAYRAAYRGVVSDFRQR